MPENERNGKKAEKYPFGVEVEFKRTIVTLEEEKEFLRIKIIDKETKKEIFNRVILN